jgi:hypothetical protein
LALVAQKPYKGQQADLTHRLSACQLQVVVEVAVATQQLVACFKCQATAVALVVVLVNLVLQD